MSSKYAAAWLRILLQLASRQPRLPFSYRDPRSMERVPWLFAGYIFVFEDMQRQRGTSAVYQLGGLVSSRVILITRSHSLLITTTASLEPSDVHTACSTSAATNLDARLLIASRDAAARLFIGRGIGGDVKTQRLCFGGVFASSMFTSVSLAHGENGAVSSYHFRCRVAVSREPVDGLEAALSFMELAKLILVT